jgi:DNA polymerase delta subunit 1
MAHNLCYTTLVTNATIRKYQLKDNDYIRTPTGAMFVKNHERKGLLPEILNQLMAIKKAKQDLSKV